MDLMALCKKRDDLMDTWLKHQEDQGVARRILAEYLVNGDGAEKLPRPIREAQQAILDRAAGG